jgi:rRNA maturation endonuclease Nob1
MNVLDSDPKAAVPSRRRDPEQRAHDFRCKKCGYQIAIPEPHPVCPMCGLGSWAPITAARNLAQTDL